MLTLPVRVGLRLWEVALLSAVIQWGMIPLMAQDFHRITLAGPLSNIPAVLLTGLIVPLGFFTRAASFVWAKLAWLMASALGFCPGLLLEVVQWFAHWPRMSYSIPGPPLWLMVAFFAAFIALSAAARRAAVGRRIRSVRRAMAPPVRPAEWISALALTFLTLLVATHPFAPNFERGKLQVTTLDVGQGDSIFVAFPQGRTLLIDGGGQPRLDRVGGSRTGPDVGEQVVSPYLWSRGLQRIDVVALTDAHHDHLDGLRSVLENFRVQELWIGRKEQSVALQSLESEAQRLGVQVLHESRGGGFNWDGVEGQVLWPADSSAAPAAANDNSIVVRLQDGRVRFLLAGDIEKHVETALIEGGAALEADFLKVPHHGSKTSSTEGFLRAVDPRVAVISFGESNPFGHPSEAVAQRYKAAGVRLLRTDRDGAVTATTDGQSLEVRSFVSLNYSGERSMDSRSEDFK